MPQRIKRWKATAIISLRGLQLSVIPEGFQQHLEALEPTTIASLYAVDVGNNSLEQLPGDIPDTMAQLGTCVGLWYIPSCGCRCVSIHILICLMILIS